MLLTLTMLIYSSFEDSTVFNSVRRFVKGEGEGARDKVLTLPILVTCHDLTYSCHNSLNTFRYRVPVSEVRYPVNLSILC